MLTMIALCWGRILNPLILVRSPLIDTIWTVGTNKVLILPHELSPFLTYLKMDWTMRLATAATVIATWLLSYLIYNSSKRKFPFPTVGLRNELFAHIRTTLRNLKEAEGLKNVIHQGYSKVRT